IRLYQGPANAGNMRAQVNLATILLESGKDPSPGVGSNVGWLRRASDQGSALAKFFLAICLLEGRGAAKNEVEGFRYCKEAADAGFPRAQGLLGELYLSGTGTARNPEQAARWYREAAAWGDTVAMFRLAGMYYEGVGVNKDVSEAYYWAVLAEATEPVEETRGMRAGIGQQLNEQQRKAAERRAQDWKPKTMPL
ncbi:MAG: sel1 repeat family protein, partial [Desulfovibrionaceae bacterium]|nr:sel1 repeat family protein [Desulfovibrionaceae bacterium]